MKRVLRSIVAIILVFIMSVSAIAHSLPVNAVVLPKDCVILKGQQLLDAAAYSKNITSKSLVSDQSTGKTYAKFVPNAGTKPEIGFTQDASGINFSSYPYWVVSYYQSQTATNLDTTVKADLSSITSIYPDKGITSNSFYGAKQPDASNGVWMTATLSRDNFSAKAGCTPTSALTGQYIRFKPWSSNAEENSFFAVEYMGFFKTEADAKAFLESLNAEVVVIENHTSNYSIVYDADAQDHIKPELDSIANSIRYGSLGVMSIETSPDSADTSPAATAKEIVIGATNRPGSSELANGLSEGEYVIKYDAASTRVFIVGGTIADTITALRYFFNTYTDEANARLAFPSTLYHEITTNYVLLDAKDLLNGTSTVDTEGQYAVYDFENKRSYVRFDPVTGTFPEISIKQALTGVNIASYPYWVISYYQSQETNKLDTTFKADGASVNAAYPGKNVSSSFYDQMKIAPSLGEWKTAVLSRSGFYNTGAEYTPTGSMTGQYLRFKPWYKTDGALDGSYFALEYLALFETETAAQSFVEATNSNAPATSLKIYSGKNEVNSVSAKEGDYIDISFEVAPFGAFKHISASSDNKAVVDIIDGRIKAIGEGKAKLTFTAGANSDAITKVIDVTVTGYRFDSIKIDGISITDYKLVIPDDCGLYTMYAAELFADYISANLNGKISIVSDASPENEYEILLGNTNRSESSTGITLGANEYFLTKSGKKLVLSENGLYTSQSIAALINDYIEANEGDDIIITNLPSSAAKKTAAPFNQKAENVIIMIGDGMGYNHVNMALNNGLDSFTANDFPVKERQITRSYSVLKGYSPYTDSAAAATALACGYKTYNGHVGLDKYKNTVKNISELAYEHGADIAVVTTDLITGATPAGFLVHNESRSNYAAIEADILALAESGMLDYHKASVGASLTINTKDALKKVTGEGKNFFVMIEDSGMDAHGNVANDVINNMIRFNDSIAYVSQFVILHPDTALIVTADHETGGIVYDSTSTYKFSFTSTEHTNTNVPVYAFGAGVDALAGGPIENIEIARFMAGVYGENNFGQTEAVSQGTVGDVDANGKLDVIDSIVLTRYLAGFTGYESKIWAEFCGIDADSEITVNDAAILSRHLASWKKYSSLPFVE